MRDMRDFRSAAENGSDRKLIVAISIAVLLLGAAIAAAFWFWKQNQHRPTAPVVAESAPPAPTEAPAAPPIAMADGDALLRQLAAQLSGSDELAKWLSGADILRRLVAAVNLVAEGNSPRSVVGFLAPGAKFEVRREHRHVVASPKSYARYDLVTRTLTSVDPTAAAKTYATLKQYIDTAFAEIGRPTRTFDAVLRQAIERLTRTQIPEDDPELTEGVLVYTYVDPKLESLSAAQKHLLRMGPTNALSIQRWLNQLNQELSKEGTQP